MKYHMNFPTLSESTFTSDYYKSHILTFINTREICSLNKASNLMVIKRVYILTKIHRFEMGK